MEENDFKRIEKMITTVVDSRLGKVEERFDAKLEQVAVNVDKKLEQVAVNVDKKLEQVTVNVDKKLEQVAVNVDKKLGHYKDEIKDYFRLQVGVMTEDFQHKLQIVAEGHQMLSEKLDRVEENMEKKIDAVAVDLAAHRADTEGHKKGYMVREP